VSGDRLAGPPQTIRDAFLRRVTDNPDDGFVYHVDGSWSFGEVDAHVRALEESIAPQLDNGSARPIGVYAGNELAAVVGLLCVWRLGRPAAICGRQLPPGSAGRLLTDAECPLILSSDQSLAEVAGDVVPILDHAVGHRSDTPGEARRSAPDEPTVGSAACICFSSGTTGKPKAMMLSHEQLVSQVTRISGGAGFAPAVSGRPMVSFSPFGHSAFLSRLALALWIGRGVALVPKFTVGAAREVVQRFRPRSLALTPSMIQMLATSPDDIDLSGLSWVSSSTAPLREDVRERFTSRFGVTILQAYGMTEVGNISIERMADIAAGNRPRGSVGRVSPGRDVRIVDGAGRVLADGAEGEIVVRDTSAAKGVPNSLPLDADGYFHTDDRGAFTADGILTLTGRNSDMIIVGGFNVSPAEIEDALQASGLVENSAVVGVPDDRLGEVPAAAVVWRADADEETLRGILRRDLAGYKVPRAFAAVPAIPLTAYGKVDRVSVRRHVMSSINISASTQSS